MDLEIWLALGVVAVAGARGGLVNAYLSDDGNSLQSRRNWGPWRQSVMRLGGSRASRVTSPEMPSSVGPRRQADRSPLRGRR